MSSVLKKGPDDGGTPNGTEKFEHPLEEAQEIVRAISVGEVDAVVVEDQGQHQLMALAKLTDLDEINELIRALKSGEVDAFIARDGETEKVYSVTPIHEVLAQQYNLTKAITDNATTALFIMDGNQQCVFMNPAAEHLTGFAFEEVRERGGPFHDLVHHTRPDGSHYPLSECPIDQVFPSQRQMQGEEVFVHKDGHFYEVGFTASPISDVTGGTIGTILEVRDITQRKAIEQALKDADRRKDEFIATLAHELRNPLAPISNMLALMKQVGDDPEVIRNARDTIERQLAKMVRLVDDLLDVSRITHNNIELRREPVELSAAINDALDMCRPMIDQLGHSIRVDIPREAIYLNADGARLSQVLGNLINNACKFTPEGGSIDVKVEREDDQVVIRVKDSGIGIPADQLGSIFDMFSQVRGSVSDTFGGLGIGLALAKQLIEMHGGTIEAKSGGEFSGSEFTVRLPIMKEAGARGIQASAATPQAPSGRRILVVDDNYDSAESMATLLQLSGNECMMAHSGPEAINAAKEFLPDVMLLDIGLPGVDGYEVCRAIREQPWGGRIWIMAMTGWGQDEDRARSKEAGFNAHLVKPVDIIKLNELIDAVPARQRAT